MGEIEYPQSIVDGAIGVVETLLRTTADEILAESRTKEDGARADPEYWRYKVERLLLWIREQMANSAIPSVNGRKIAHLYYTPMEEAKPAVTYRPATKYKPERKAAPAVAGTRARLSLHIKPWQQQESTISAEVYDNVLAHLTM